MGKAINALDDKVTDKLHLDEIFVPSEHALAVEQSNEEMRQIEDLVRQAEQTQNSEWYTGGYVTERVVTTVAASALFGGSEIAGAVAEKVGGGILAKYATEYAVTVACDTVVDTVVDTVPEMINNSYAGMSQEEVWDNAKDNFLGNLGINALTAGVGTGVKILGDAGDGVKAFGNTADTATKALDNGADTFKLVDNGTDVVKMAGTGADALKISDDTADAVKAASKATEEAAEQAANAAMTTSKATDTAIAVTKTADTAKTAEHIAESTKAADADNAVEISIEKSKAIGDQDCIVKKADPTPDSNIHAEKTFLVIMVAIIQALEI